VARHRYSRHLQGKRELLTRSSHGLVVDEDVFFRDPLTQELKEKNRLGFDDLLLNEVEHMLVRVWTPTVEQVQHASKGFNVVEEVRTPSHPYLFVTLVNYSSSFFLFCS